jgi:hypothetical protein
MGFYLWGHGILHPVCLISRADQKNAQKPAVSHKSLTNPSVSAINPSVSAVLVIKLDYFCGETIIKFGLLIYLLPFHRSPIHSREGDDLSLKKYYYEA